MNHYFYICDVCEYQYDEDDTGLLWCQLPKLWTCISCGNSKETFKLIEVNNAKPNTRLIQQQNCAL